MPTYDYHCPANGRTIEISHKMADEVRTWGELCRRAGIARGETASNARVEKLITGGNVITTGSLGSGGQERPCDSGPCDAPACGTGACAWN
jgi:predicted nucleic acid-binding Zn ribbon protein